MKTALPFLLICPWLVGCSEKTPAPEEPAAKVGVAETSTAPRVNDDDWVGVYSSPEEIGGFSGTVLVIDKSIVGDGLNYRKSFYSDVHVADDIEQDVRTGSCLIDGNRIFIPEAFGYMRDGKPQLQASIERFTRATINGRVVLLRDDARQAYESENKLYDYGILMKVADKADLLLKFDEVKHESIKVLYTDQSKAWKDPFTHGPNER
jgi:hypothetical protein